MSSNIRNQLDSLPSRVRVMLETYGFDADWFEHHSRRLVDGGEADNLVTGEIAPPEPEDVIDAPERDSPEYQRLAAIGEKALAEGRCGLVVLAGGMATRMGSVVKSLVEALPGRSFLDLRLAGQRTLEERTGGTIPLWLMTSHATDEAIRAALGDDLDGYRIATFPQNVSIRLTPDGRLFADDSGEASLHSPGHGDFPDAVRRSGLLDEFLSRGGRHLTVANIDNLGATLDPAVIGGHIDRGVSVTCEVVDKIGSDRGGIPARRDGRPVVLEEFRIPPTFDPSQVRVFNTNTFHFDARALSDLSMDWTYFIVNKEVDGRPAIQFERLVNEVADHLQTRFLRVPRKGAQSRFLPVKDHDDLAAKKPDIEAVARDRGML